MPPQAAAARKILPIPSDWRVFMKDLGVSFFTGYDIGNTGSTGTSWPATHREWFLTRFLVLSEKMFSNAA
jgi:hypothetical protein